MKSKNWTHTAWFFGAVGLIEIGWLIFWVVYACGGVKL